MLVVVADKGIQHDENDIEIIDQKIEPDQPGGSPSGKPARTAPGQQSGKNVTAGGRR
jgi:hypothetical protein